MTDSRNTVKQCWATLATGGNKGKRCSYKCRNSSNFCGNHKKWDKLVLPLNTNEVVIKQSALYKLREIISALRREHFHDMDTINHLKTDNDFLREDIATRINETEELVDYMRHWQGKTHMWTQSTLKLNMLIRDIKRQSTSEHTHMLCDQTQYIEFPEDLTSELYRLYNMNYNPQ